MFTDKQKNDTNYNIFDDIYDAKLEFYNFNVKTKEQFILWIQKIRNSKLFFGLRDTRLDIENPPLLNSLTIQTLKLNLSLIGWFPIYLINNALSKGTEDDDSQDDDDDDNKKEELKFKYYYFILKSKKTVGLSIFEYRPNFIEEFKYDNSNYFDTMSPDWNWSQASFVNINTPSSSNGPKEEEEEKNEHNYSLFSIGIFFNVDDNKILHRCFFYTNNLVF